MTRAAALARPASPVRALRAAATSVTSPAASTGRATGSEYVERATCRSGKSSAVPSAARGPQRGPVTSEPSSPMASTDRPHSTRRQDERRRRPARPPGHGVPRGRPDGELRLDRRLLRRARRVEGRAGQRHALDLEDGRAADGRRRDLDRCGRGPRRAGRPTGGRSPSPGAAGPARSGCCRPRPPTPRRAARGGWPTRAARDGTGTREARRADATSSRSRTTPATHGCHQPSSDRTAAAPEPRTSHAPTVTTTRVRTQPLHASPRSSGRSPVSGV